MVLAIVGSGGKTTRIHQLAEKYRKEGKRVFVTTTTHMYQEEGCDISADADSILEKLKIHGYCMAGCSSRDHKITALPEEVYLEVCEAADVVLVEADGSKGLPIKYPSEHEPVIPENADEIQIVIGMSALGRPLGAASHRKELVMQCLDAKEDTVLTVTHLQTLVQKGYLEPLRKQYPDKKIGVYPGQVNTLYERDAAKILTNLVEKE